MRRDTSRGAYPPGWVLFLLDENDLLGVFDTFPDRRARRSIAPFFFGHTMVLRSLFRLPRLAQIGDTLFRSPYILRLLRFNARQVDEGFYPKCSRNREERGEDPLPFDPEALGEFFALCSQKEFLTHQIAWLKAIHARWPHLLRNAEWMMDGIYFSTPRGGHGVEAGEYLACVLGVRSPTHGGNESEGDAHDIWPLLWVFGDKDASELTLVKQLLTAVHEALGEDVIGHLTVDAGYIDGGWLTQMWKSNTSMTLRVRGDMNVFDDMVGLSRLSGENWMKVKPPKTRSDSKPAREIIGFDRLETWSACKAPLRGCLVRDTYKDGKQKLHAIVQTGKPDRLGEGSVDPRPIYQAYRRRWEIEETFMAWTRYWRFDDLPGCRRGVAFAMVHFSMLAYTLLGLYFHVEGIGKRPCSPPPMVVPGREFAVYAGEYFTLLPGSAIIQLILDNLPAWQTNKDAIIDAMKMTEGPP